MPGKRLFVKSSTQCGKKDGKSHHPAAKPSFGYLLGCLGEGPEHLSNKDLSTVIQVITGHNHLKYHEFKVGRSKSNTCRFCKTEHKEFIYLECNCPALAKEHIETFRVHLPKKNLLDLNSLLTFTKVNHINQAINFTGAN